MIIIMKGKDILDGLDHVGDDLIQESSSPSNGRQKHIFIRVAAAAVILVTLAASLAALLPAMPGGGEEPSGTVIILPGTERPIVSDGRRCVSDADMSGDMMPGSADTSAEGRRPITVPFVPEHDISGYPAELTPKLADKLAANADEDVLYWVRITCRQWIEMDTSGDWLNEEYTNRDAAAFDVFRQAGLYPEGRTEILTSYFDNTDDSVPLPTTIIGLWSRDEIFSFTDAYDGLYPGLELLTVQLHYDIYDPMLKFFGNSHTYAMYSALGEDEYLPLQININLPPLCGFEIPEGLVWADFAAPAVDALATVPACELFRATGSLYLERKITQNYIPKRLRTGSRVNSSLYGAVSSSIRTFEERKDGHDILPENGVSERTRLTRDNISVIFPDGDLTRILHEQYDMALELCGEMNADTKLTDFSVYGVIHVFTALTKAQINSLISAGADGNLLLMYNDYNIPEKALKKCVEFKIQLGNQVRYRQPIVHAAE